jgi:hypothetical protein
MANGQSQPRMVRSVLPVEQIVDLVTQEIADHPGQ